MNVDFVIYNAAGEILRTGNCPEEFVDMQVQADEFCILGQAHPANDAVDPVTRTVIPNGNPNSPQPIPLPPQPSATISTATQLDLLWQAMDAGTFPKAEPFYSAVKATKGTA